jgi:oxaloacetate decarboxylase alpha subunit
MAKPLGITDVVLRDAHQSLLATRLRIDDMLPICSKLDKVGFWSLESWGGATFDACIRYLGEDPWDRLRELKKALPKTPLQMLLRGQNLLGYRHYADDVVDKFVERCAVNGVDVFRIFDAVNDPRNFERAIKATIANGKHAQGTISYTVSPVHTIEMWVDLAKRLEDMGSHSIAIKDMAGLLKPYEAFELVTRLKKAVKVPIHMQCHATTGLSTATIMKAAEAGIDNVDTAISSMSMTYGHSATEAVVAALAVIVLLLTTISLSVCFLINAVVSLIHCSGSPRFIAVQILESGGINNIRFPRLNLVRSGLAISNRSLDLSTIGNQL